MQKHWALWSAVVLLIPVAVAGRAQQPAEPVDATPIDGEVYALMNQAIGLQLSVIASGGSGGPVVEAQRDLGSLAQRWSVVRLYDRSWKIVNRANGLCLAEANPARVDARAERCRSSADQRWLIVEGANGYATLQNAASGAMLTSHNGSAPQAASAGTPPQTQLWQLRPAFLRGADTAEQEKMEAIRVQTGLPWWKDAEQPEDFLQILKNHGFNAIRLRPTSIPPYYPNQPPNTCTGNFCYIETEAQELDLARRARNLGFSLELTLFFDGGGSKSVPGSWAGQTPDQLAASVYGYTRAEVEKYRQAGLMPDLVSVGNEVDTGFLGYYPYNNFAIFAQLEKAGLTAVADASSDTGIGPALPTPLTCIHITPPYDLVSFAQSAGAHGLTYDALCQSYYPIYHGPLTQAQANLTNPQKKPVEAAALLRAAQTLGKPIFIMETAEHYGNGFGSNDPWYAPTPAAQRQFLLDLQGVLKSLPGNLAIGMQYWAPNDVQMPDGGGPYSTFQKDYLSPNAIFAWEGLSLFDSADPNYLTDAAAPNYSTALPGIDAMGGKLDPTLAYKLTSRASRLLLQGTSEAVGVSLRSFQSGIDGAVEPEAQWRIAGDGNGAFTVANLQGSAAGTMVLDGGAPSTGASFVVEAAANGSPSQSWDVRTASGGYFFLVNQATGMKLDVDSLGHAVESPLAATGYSSQWAITPVAITRGR